MDDFAKTMPIVAVYFYVYLLIVSLRPCRGHGRFYPERFQIMGRFYPLPETGIKTAKINPLAKTMIYDRAGINGFNERRFL
jgi:hypothetical protein